MIKQILKFIVPYVIFGLVLSGCSGELKTKTIIIPDSEESNPIQTVNEDFVVNKIYKLMEEDTSNGDILGWADKEQVLGVFGRKDKERSLERIDYSYNSRQKLINIAANTEVENVSPNGVYLVKTAANEDGQRKLLLHNLTDNKEDVITEIVKTNIRTNPVTWSNNSRFVASLQWDRNKAETKLIIYDVISRSANELLFPNRNERDMIYNVKVSDDGKSVLLMKFADGQTYVVYGKLVGSEMANQYEQPVNSEGSFDFINDDQIMFVGQKGTLYLYDIRNANTTILLDQIGSFGLSSDRKYIAFSKGRESIYVAKLQGNTVVNEIEIYKGMIPFQMNWSKDNKKILIYGWRSYGPLPVAVPRPALTTTPERNGPFIIEFK
ncbi:hypothetical protein [Paenibacillus radicis (ex Xue et al. 2023)]|uniref:WD40 repeat domain-containing protein n=1 Tax=Paenibacillus radicis (ex Xue et al. 2023) TaxID=2972489 RepID=A0ABT1YF11_9BACL|nr:hypothetical protein [Paenibacillus radicis (ex Xue et al. 2023)]MCR8631787.1 hypothetical protein [Paenibacillus radicis (ex Xue et al. 2023)]